MKKIQNMKHGKESMVARLEYFQQQITECENGIPENLWCEKCKEMCEKVNHLKVEKAAMDIRDQVISNYTDHVVYGSEFDSPKFFCRDCYRLYYSLEEIHNSENLCVCGGVIVSIEKAFE